MASEQPLLSVKELEAAYGHVKVLHGIDLVVRPAEIVALLGPNGAGKTTTVKAMLGLVNKLAGTVMFGDLDITSLAPHKIADLGIAVVPEGRGVFPALTVRENLRVGVAFKTGGRDLVEQGYDRAFEQFPILSARQAQLAGTLSGGEQTMLALARAMISNPSLILMDEPSLGLAPQLIEECFDIVAQFQSSGTAVLLIEQNATQALEICSRAYVLQKGHIAVHGTRAELLNDQRIRDAYFQIST